MANALSDNERRLMDAYWRAANYLSVGQIYLYDNPLLKQPLTKEHIKPRLLGHWGTTPGLNFIYVHLNRLIKKHDLNMIYITGPGHGGRPCRERLSRGDVQRGLSEHLSQ
jgi:xylulose-5-phosphate/fructose-6-phosphate phosphoketolase